ncbi:TBC1 domain family member 8 [Ananas comosus]|uniref:TBC1 domain family member 8 n=1 Tax=Ananas comosus TaxID=4615 RepID=A0A199VBZ3_ANACO|nr:TBC1 domain family member 8 [Ananas comosus]
MRGKSSKTSAPVVVTFEHKRDAYGFAVRPQHLQRYREYAKIYKEEEEERTKRWKDLLERLVEESEEDLKRSEEVIGGKCDGSEEAFLEKGLWEELENQNAESWSRMRPSLGAIESMMSYRLTKRKRALYDGQKDQLTSIEEEARPSRGSREEESEEEFYDVERSEPIQELPSDDDGGVSSTIVCEPSFPWKEELESLIRGGIPMALRGELWQAFVGVRTRRVDGYYKKLLDQEGKTIEDKEIEDSVPEKWKGQIEKDLPRTFPGHPALDNDGRNALRRLLTAYARHNPSVGYCQAMNFFGGLLLLLMPEENAFWTLMGIIDDYFDGYYNEQMIESQVDQLVLEELVRERFPKLARHLDYLGVQVAWVTGPWFLSIFVNILPWESVLRVWDVLLFEGNRTMLFRTALALMELYGPALVTTKDAGDGVTLLQSLAGSTFDSSQLVLIACMGYQFVTEIKLQELRKKHRPEVLAALEERSKELRNWKKSKDLASKMYSFKHDPASILPQSNSNEVISDSEMNGDLHLFNSESENDKEIDSVPDLQEQVKCLKVELCRLLEEKRSAVLRAEELETALMEMVKQDNRRLLSAKVEQLEQELLELRRALADKNEQEQAMLQVLLRVEQEQKVTEDARVSAERDAAAQRYAAQVLQAKYEQAMGALSEMEKRAIMAETMLEATLQYQSGQVKAHQPFSSRAVHMDQPLARTNQDSSHDASNRMVGLLSRPFGIGWLDKNKGKLNSAETIEGKTPASMGQKDMNGV